MIRITTINQLDSSQESFTKNISMDFIESMLILSNYKYNKITGYWEKENECVLVERVEE